MRTFLADASHELRTPVAALHATAERLLRDQPARPARDAIEAQLARDSGRLGHLIDDLLNLARLDARERPHRVPVDLTDLASAAVAATRTTDPAVHVELVTNGPVSGHRRPRRATARRPQPARQRVRGRRHGRGRGGTDSGRSDHVGDRRRAWGPRRSARTDLRAVRPPWRAGHPISARWHGPRARDRPPDDRITRRHDHLRSVPDRRRPIHAPTTSQLLTGPDSSTESLSLPPGGATAVAGALRRALVGGASAADDDRRR